MYLLFALIEQMGTIERGGFSIADGQKLNEAMKETAEALEKIVTTMEVIQRHARLTSTP